MRWIFALMLTPLLAAQNADVESAFTSLFDGVSMKGWRMTGGSSRPYYVENGSLVCPADGDRTLYSDKEYSDFILRFEYRIEPAGNSGIAIRAPGSGRASQVGMEIQILDDKHEKYKGQIRPEDYSGSIYDVMPARTGFQKPAGEWNEEEISAIGSRITVKLNGVIVLDVDLNIVKEPAILKRHPGIARRKGYIGLLGHWSRVEFRNLRIRELTTN